MSKQVKISKLCLEIGGKKIELTMKQAKELSEVLNDTFGSTEVVFRDRWHYPYQPYPYTYTTFNGATCSANLTASSGAVCATDTALWHGELSGNQVTLTAQ